jgi:hypothetical protein
MATFSLARVRHKGVKAILLYEYCSIIRSDFFYLPTRAQGKMSRGPRLTPRERHGVT